ncbi:MAG: hypothetical protein AMJ93_08860 [Anaerolineae bacterium SM23_84]|nr:MAG: hypothetical protein AMJ93_08860 [Anaerolineae bacterium SM23_84]
MLAVVSWWLIMEVMGLLVLPLSLRVFRHLPDRGYALAKPLGLLLTGYLLWIGASFGFLSNSRTGILFCMVLVGLASLVLWQRERGSIRTFFSRNKRVIAATELLFALAFVGWAVVRAYNPDIAATEKPMEIAFLNTILRSERFPAHDPWLSGFAISYYHFGYLLVAVLTKLSGVAASIGFNLAISLLFALTATGAFSLVYNLVATDMGQSARQGISSIAWALMGPLFVVLIGNLEGLFEVLHTRGLGSPRFWQWLDVEGLTSAPVNGRWVPTDMWWWWRASRVVNDRDLRGVHMEVIDEFPQFSFLLGDMHPHVLALPFVVLALALALNLLLGARDWTTERLAEDASSVEGDVAKRWSLLRRGPRLLSVMWQEHGFDILAVALCLGALGFLFRVVLGRNGNPAILAILPGLSVSGWRRAAPVLQHHPCSSVSDHVWPFCVRPSQLHRATVARSVLFLTERGAPRILDRPAEPAAVAGVGTPAVNAAGCLAHCRHADGEAVLGGCPGRRAGTAGIGGAGDSRIDKVQCSDALGESLDAVAGGLADRLTVVLDAAFLARSAGDS